MALELDVGKLAGPARTLGTRREANARREAALVRVLGAVPASILGGVGRGKSGGVGGTRTSVEETRGESSKRTQRELRRARRDELLLSSQGRQLSFLFIIYGLQHRLRDPTTLNGRV